MPTKELRLVGTADLHIGDWSQFSELGSDGRPSRLIKYLTLASDISTFATEIKADAIVIAGDLVEQSLLRPMVLDVLNEFINILTVNHLVLVTHGQHDLDTKTMEISRFHSALTHLKSRQNLVYADEARTHMVKGFNVLLSPWNNSHDLPSDLTRADVFVGHGMVRGTANAEGYVFQGGFRQEELLKRFPVSIIGDVHNGISIEQDGRLILVPGTPIQNTYKDSPKVGLWKVTLEKGGAAGCGFISIHDIRPNFYHQFLFTDQPDIDSTSLIHYRFRPAKAKGRAGLSTPVHSSRELSLQDACEHVLQRAKIEDKVTVRQLIVEALQGLRSTDRQIPHVNVLSLDVRGFMSIDRFQLQMEQFPDNLVIIGENGHGKTAIFEALFWGLTGQTTKGTPANDVVNEYGSGRCQVSVHLLVGGDVAYRITRARENNKPELSLQVFDWETKQFHDAHIDKGKTGATQDMINRLLGLTPQEILMLSYFSAKDPVLFGTLGQADKNTLMATVSNADEVENLRALFSKQLSETEKNQIRVTTRIDVLKRTHEANKAQIRDMVAQQDRDDSGELTRAQALEVELHDRIVTSPDNLEELEQLSTGLANKISKLTQERTKAESEGVQLDQLASRMTGSMQTLKGQIRQALDGKCPTCKQDMHDPAVLDALTVELAQIKAKAPKAGDVQALLDKCAGLDTRIRELQLQFTDVQGRLQALRKANRDLNEVRDRIAALGGRKPNYLPLIEAQARNLERDALEIITLEGEQAEINKRYVAEDWIYGTLLKRNGPLIQLLNQQVKNMLQIEVDELTRDGGFKVSIDDSLNVSASYMGRKATSYKNLSSGQARILDVVMMVALNNLFTKIYGLPQGVLGLVIFDEVLSYLDDKYMDFAFSLLERIQVGKRLVITHDARLMGRFDHRIHVKLVGETSSTYTKSWS